MRKLLFVLSLIGGLLSVPTNLMADEGQKKTIRMFLNTGELLDFDAAVIDSITFTSDAQTIWYEDTCRTVAIEAVDSIWYMSPTLRLTTQSLDFGKVAVGNSKTLTATLTNTGDQIERYMMLATNAFSVSAAAQELFLKPNESVDVELAFAPSDSISYTSMLLIGSSAVEGGVTNIALYGEGVANAGQEEDVYIPPVEQSFHILLNENDEIENFKDFKIVNINGEYPLDVTDMAKSKRRTRRTDNTFNIYRTKAVVSSAGLQLHSLTDANGYPYMLTITLPGEQPEFSFEQTALAIMLSTPFLSPSDQADYRNTVTLLKSLQTFNVFAYNLRQEYDAAIAEKRVPDYSKVSPDKVFSEIFYLSSDNHTDKLSGIEIKDLNVTPRAANFKLHNDFRRSVAVYASRLKMNETNLVVTDQEEITMTFGEIINMMLDHYLENLDDEAFKDLEKLDDEDIAYLLVTREMVHELEEIIANDDVLKTPIPIWVPYIMESGKSNYWDIVCDARWDLYWKTYFAGMPEDGVREYLTSNDKSIFAKDSPEMEIEFNGYDKIQLDIYGLGIFNDKSWSAMTKAEQARVIMMLMYGGYNDVVKPFWEILVGSVKAYRASNAIYKYDFRYGARKYPELALITKLYLEFRKKKENIQTIIQLAEERDLAGMIKFVSEFMLNEMKKLPAEAEDPYSLENRRTYLNLIYNIGKKWTGVTATKAAFRESLKKIANTLLTKIAFTLRTIDITENLMNEEGALYALKNSKQKETFIINKYDEAYIEVTEPTVTYLTSDVDVHFAWKFNAGNNYGNYNYALEFVTETLSDVIPTVVQTNIKEMSFDYNLSKLPNAKSARRILFRVIAHRADEPEKILVMTDYIPLVENISVNLVETPEVVDLGLPSGTKWAVCNLGAKSAEKHGNYYAWGETDTKSTFNWKTYKYSGNTSNSLTKYCTKSSYGKVDNKTCLEPADDRVKSDYGYYWSIPTKEDWQELIDKCTWSRFGDDFMVRGPNGNIILLPAAGYQDGLNTYDVGKEGCYWATSIDEGSPDDAWYMHVMNAKPKLYSYYRYQGRCIRPVQHKANYAAPNMAQ